MRTSSKDKEEDKKQQRNLIPVYLTLTFAAQHSGETTIPRALSEKISGGSSREQSPRRK